MRADKIREIDDKDLALRVKEMQEQIFRLKFQISMGQMDGLKKYRELRKDKARIFTVQRERQLKEAK